MAPERYRLYRYHASINTEPNSRDNIMIIVEKFESEFGIITYLMKLNKLVLYEWGFTGLSFSIVYSFSAHLIIQPNCVWKAVEIIRFSFWPFQSFYRGRYLKHLFLSTIRDVLNHPSNKIIRLINHLPKRFSTFNWYGGNFIKSIGTRSDRVDIFISILYDSWMIIFYYLLLFELILHYHCLQVNIHFYLKVSLPLCWK